MKRNFITMLSLVVMSLIAQRHRCLRSVLREGRCAVRF